MSTSLREPSLTKQYAVFSSPVVDAVPARRKVGKVCWTKGEQAPAALFGDADSPWQSRAGRSGFSVGGYTVWIRGCWIKQINNIEKETRS